MLLLQVSDYLINEQHEARLLEAETDRLARAARSAGVNRPSTPSRDSQPAGRGPRLATLVSRLVGRAAGI